MAEGVIGVNEAFEKLEVESYDLILSDHIMGTSTGKEVLLKIRQIHPDTYIPFVMITGQSNRALHREIMEMGADDFILKPYTTKDIISSVERQIQKVNFWRNRIEAMANFTEENPNPVLRIGNGDLKITFSNSAFDKKFDDLEEDRRSELIAFLQNAVRDAVQSAETLVRPYFLFGENYNVTFSPHKTKAYTNIYFSDITRMIEAEANLIRRESFYKEVLDNMPADLAVFDKDHRYRYVNPNGIKNKSIREWIVGKNDYEYAAYKKISDLSSFDARRKVFNDSVKNHKDEHWVDRYQEKGKEDRYVLRKFHPVVNEKGDVNLVIGYGIDISDRVSAELSVKKSQARYKMLFDNNPQMVFILNRSGIVVDLNQSAITQLGYAEEELKDNSVLKVFPKDTHALVKKTIEQCFRNSVEKYEWELIKVKKDGSLMNVHEVASCLSFEESNEQLLLIVCTDITEKKQNEELLKETIHLKDTLVDMMPVPVAIMKEGVITDSNLMLRELLEMSKEELVGKSLGEIALPEYHELISSKILERLNSNERILTCELEITTGGKQIKKVQINGSLIAEKDGNKTIAVFHELK